MVTPNSSEKRNRPEYSLDRVRELAANGKVIYGSKDVQRDITNLSYSPEDVCKCLSKLEKIHYVETVHYDNAPVWLDVYKCTWQVAEHQSDPLYIKLKLNKDCITIVLTSFHREGSL